MHNNAHKANRPWPIAYWAVVLLARSILRSILLHHLDRRRHLLRGITQAADRLGELHNIMGNIIELPPIIAHFGQISIFVFFIMFTISKHIQEK